MIRTLIVTATIGMAALSGAGAAQAYDLEEQCRVATIPTAICDGHGGVIPGGHLAGGNDSAGVNNARIQGPTKYFNGLGPSVVYGYDKNQPLKNEDGTPKLDADGNQMYAPIMGPGTPTEGTKPGTEAGRTDSDGNRVVDYTGYTPK